MCDSVIVGKEFYVTWSLNNINPHDLVHITTKNMSNIPETILNKNVRSLSIHTRKRLTDLNKQIDHKMWFQQQCTCDQNYFKRGILFLKKIFDKLY